MFTGKKLAYSKTQLNTKKYIFKSNIKNVN